MRHPQSLNLLKTKWNLETKIENAKKALIQKSYGHELNGIPSKPNDFWIGFTVVNNSRYNI